MKTGNNNTLANTMPALHRSWVASHPSSSTGANVARTSDGTYLAM